jgi:hypothetical protein
MAVDARVARRKLFIRLGQKQHRPGRGSSRAFLTARTTHMHWPDLTNIFQPIEYAVVGGVATRLYMPERLTKDLDVIIAAAQADEAAIKLKAVGYQLIERLGLVEGSTWISPDGQEVDVLEGLEPWWPEAIRAAQTNRDGQGLPTLPLPYLVLMKYLAGRAQDLADIERMLGQTTNAALEDVRRAFERFAPNELDDLDSLITLAKLERGDEG